MPPVAVPPPVAAIELALEADVIALDEADAEVDADELVSLSSLHEASVSAGMTANERSVCRMAANRIGTLARDVRFLGCSVAAAIAET
jgi:hypothetical protein